MRIVIDLQGAQTESRFRGIGRYSLSLVKAIVRNRGEHEIIIVLNGLLADTIEPIRAEFDGLLPQENIRVWYVPGPVCEVEIKNMWRREAAELVREAFIANLQPDIVHITSLFEGYGDDAITSIGRFDKTTPVSVSLYDLIPLLNPEQYLKPNPAYAQYYQRKIEHLKHSSLLLAISEYSQDEARVTLDLNKSSIVNVSTAVEDSFQPLALDQAQTEVTRDRFGITRPFLLYTGGVDERKNLPRLIRAYAKLSSPLRKTHQLVFAGKMAEGDALQLKQEAKTAGLRSDELILTGYITDEELVKLYNLCELYVFPSWHEGFGLPALEAMSCGAIVIGANTSSLPEVIGSKEALFDPFSEEEITSKMERVLTDEDYRKKLLLTGLSQAKKFSWDRSAKSAITAFETILSRDVKKSDNSKTGQRKKLAFVSPLPPEKTGIADYSADLLPALSSYYDIDVIVSQVGITEQWVNESCHIRSAEWLLKNSDKYDRVLYHFGNSPFHQYMYPLLKEVPGTICLHDFYMSGYSRYMELTGQELFHWTKDLYHTHGYHAVRDRFHLADNEKVMYKYPCNLNILQLANGVIVHSNYSKQLAKEWFNNKMSSDWSVIPLLRQPAQLHQSSTFRERLNIPEDAFVVCSYGGVDETKLNDRLIKAWLASSLSKDSSCYLIFVGQNHEGDFGKALCEMISSNKASHNVRITGWVSLDEFKLYLSTANMAVQLRTRSRGETSAAVMDCMNYSIPTIVNANGSMAELSSDTVWMLDDEFEDGDLIRALETLRTGTGKRRDLSIKAKKTIDIHHSPDACAKKYVESIERFYNSKQSDCQHLIASLGKSKHLAADEEYLKHMASCIAQNQPIKRYSRTLFIDVTATRQADLKTGIERVARALLLEFINNPPEGFRVEPVYLTLQGGVWQYRYARSYTLDLLECPSEWIDDDVIEAFPGDKLFAADLAGHVVVEAQKAGVYDRLRDIGVNITFTVFDLLPYKYPDVFPPGAKAAFIGWLESVCQIADKVVCISKAVADELNDWRSNTLVERIRPLSIDWFHLGADIESTRPTEGMPFEAEAQLAMLTVEPTFLMVGTIEPRKGHLQAIEAFEKLWNEGYNVKLVIVGKEGWQGLPDDERRTIPQIIDTLSQHSELGKRLFWLDGISDEFLEKIYSVSTCLLAASEAEGFGLPLIEAAQYQLPIIARDIPVFREVAGQHAFYFSGKTSDALCNSIGEWLNLYHDGRYPVSDDLPWKSWSESAADLFQVLSIHNK
ncbi:glycosyltransferase [Vibrio sp. 10N.261.46.E11]|uniref:glycosyltransferase n=1 Tax=Vibrio sp. 10N.261.46.E11 TaxID=3229662 RepID=UPI0035521E1D